LDAERSGEWTEKNSLPKEKHPVTWLPTALSTADRHGFRDDRGNRVVEQPGLAKLTKGDAARAIARVLEQGWSGRGY
jgi:hypothetical protein